ncbi:MAG: DUF4250 domain-containing protein [Lachnospiraceae bacterium]|nr:DUF4250 domain-containing protein [Lachnospiraceae bacterium]
MLPKDPNMLLSMINMKLRDSGKNLEELCDELGVDVTEVTDPLEEAGYSYNAQNNCFH